MFRVDGFILEKEYMDIRGKKINFLYFILFLNNFYFMCMSLLFECLFVYCVFVSGYRILKRMFRFFERVWNYYVDVMN